MKLNSFKVLFVLALATLSSCDNEPLEGFDLTQTSQFANGQPAPNSTSIPGTWKLTAWDASNAVDINNDGTASINLLEELNCYTNETIVFTATGTAISMSRSYADIEVELVIGTTDEYTFMSTCVPEIDNTDLTWEQTGNNIAITDVASGGINNFTLTGNQMSFLIPEGFDVSNGSGTATVTEDLVLVYTKQ